jgi:hypothetical protein
MLFCSARRNFKLFTENLSRNFHDIYILVAGECAVFVVMRNLEIS